MSTSPDPEETGPDLFLVESIAAVLALSRTARTGDLANPRVEDGDRDDAEFLVSTLLLRVEYDDAVAEDRPEGARRQERMVTPWTDARRR